MSESEQAREAILAERIRRGYEVAVLEMHPTAFLGGVILPEGSFVGETVCLLHDPPCQWQDWAIPRRIGYRVIFWTELLHPERSISERVRQILSECLTQEEER